MPRRRAIKGTGGCRYALGLLAGLILAPAPIDAPAVPPGDESVRPAVAEQLAAVRAALADADHQDAVTRLKALLPKVARDPVEAALTYELLGHLYLRQDRVEDAVRALDKALARDGLGPMRTRAIRLAVLRALTEAGDRGEARRRLQTWFGVEPYADPEIRVLAASLDRAAGMHPATLSELAARRPGDRAVWLRLAELHREAGRPEAAIAALMIGRANGALTGSDLAHLAALQAAHGAPVTAADTLSTAMAEGMLEATAKLQLQLAEYLLAAGDRHGAGTVLAAAARLDPDPVLLRWVEIALAEPIAGDAADAACRHLLAWRGTSGDPERRDLYRGICELRSGQRAAAIAALSRVPADSRWRADAARWLRHARERTRG